MLRGDTQVAEINAPGAVFGEMSALLGIHHTATVRVVKPVVAYLIEDADAFLRK